MGSFGIKLQAAVVMSFLVFCCSEISTNLWLSAWSDDTRIQNSSRIPQYFSSIIDKPMSVDARIGVYSALGTFQGILIEGPVPEVISDGYFRTPHLRGICFTLRAFKFGST